MNSRSNHLVERAQRGSREALGALYTDHHQKIYRYLYYRTGDPQTAEDLTADVFLKMVRAIPGYQAGAIPFQAWLYQIARNIAIDHHRHNAAHPLETIQENLRTSEKVEETLDRRLTRNALSRALSELEELQRDVLVLRFIEGMPILEVAQTLHKSEDAVKALQRRGLIALRGKINLPENP